jgi:hypothetical protein
MIPEELRREVSWASVRSHLMPTTDMCQVQNIFYIENISPSQSRRPVNVSVGFLSLVKDCLALRGDPNILPQDQGRANFCIDLNMRDDYGRVIF